MNDAVKKLIEKQIKYLEFNLEGERDEMHRAEARAAAAKQRVEETQSEIGLLRESLN